MRILLERTFELSKRETSIKQEIVAGCTTFLAMAYITIVNPSILSDAGMDFGGVFVATCLAAAIGSLIMGFLANYPIALAPGMGQNAFFAYTIVIGMGHSWQTALATVFISGCLFIPDQPAPGQGIDHQLYPEKSETCNYLRNRLISRIYRLSKRCSRARRPINPGGHSKFSQCCSSLALLGLFSSLH